MTRSRQARVARILESIAARAEQALRRWARTVLGMLFIAAMAWSADYEELPPLLSAAGIAIVAAAWWGRFMADAPLDLPFDAPWQAEADELARALGYRRFVEGESDPGPPWNRSRVASLLGGASLDADVRYLADLSKAQILGDGRPQPWLGGGIDEETAEIAGPLLRLNDAGIVTINSQPQQYSDETVEAVLSDRGDDPFADELDPLPTAGVLAWVEVVGSRERLVPFVNEVAQRGHTIGSCSDWNPRPVPWLVRYRTAVRRLFKTNERHERWVIASVRSGRHLGERFWTDVVDVAEGRRSSDEQESGETADGTEQEERSA